jgi:hypothetical protein
VERRKTEREIEASDKYEKPDEAISEKYDDFILYLMSKFSSIHSTRFLNNKKQEYSECEIDEEIKKWNILNGEVDSWDTVS